LKLIHGHCDPTVNLYAWYVCIRNGRVEALWRIIAGGPVLWSEPPRRQGRQENRMDPPMNADKRGYISGKLLATEHTEIAENRQERQITRSLRTLHVSGFQKGLRVLVLV
jgi:hypothetical protein